MPRSYTTFGVRLYSGLGSFLAGLLLAGCANGSLAPTFNETTNVCAAGKNDLARPKGICPADRTGGRVADLRGTEGLAYRSGASSRNPLTATAGAPQVRAAGALQDVAGAEIDRVIAGRRPSLALEAAVGAEGGRGSDYDHQRFGGSYAYGLRLGMPVYDGGRRTAAIAAAQSDFVAAGEVAQQRYASAALDLALALADGERYRANLATLSRQESSLKRLAADVRDTVRASAGSQVDLDDIERQQARVAGQRQDVQFGLSAAEAVAARYGVSIRTAPPAPATRVRTGGERDLFALAIQQNPRLRERTSRIASASARVSEAEREYLPTVSVDMGVSGSDRTLPGVRDEHLGSANLRLSVPLLDGGVRSAGIRKRQGERISAEFDRETTAAEIGQSVRASVMRRDAARRFLAQAQRERRLAQSMLEGVRQERSVGVRSTFDEIRANEDLASAEIAIAAARWQELTASYVLAAETGLIVDDANRVAAR